MLQSILFNKNFFTKHEALQWLIKNKYKPYKIHETQHFYRFRMTEPIHNAKYRIKKIYPGIEFILMY